MSVEKRQQEARRWLAQGQDDLGAATVLLAGDKYAQAAFYAQQGAEKAVKALWFALDEEPWGHSITRLINDLPADKEQHALGRLLDEAKTLDKHYIPTRYPDAFPDLTPSEVYTQREAKEAIASAKRLIECSDALLKAHRL